MIVRDDGGDIVTYASKARLAMEEVQVKVVEESGLSER